MNRRIVRHPILGDLEARQDVIIYFDGKPITAREDEPIAAALMSAGIRVFRRTKRRGEGRGLFCAIGRCTDCMMVVDGVPNVRTCITPVREGMRVATQFGYGIKPETRE
jgi:predicted molibdopterin-dependent oxidoreductase YjgC